MPLASGDAAKSQAIYEFWANPKVKAESILSSHRDAVVSRSAGYETVLAIQDTTELNLTSHRATEGLGFINQSKQQGLKVHSCFVVSEEGLPLGVVHQQSWSRQKRSGKSQHRRKLPIQHKESYRWLESATAAEDALGDSPRIVHVGDREADIFELFAQPRQANAELLIRAEHNRKVDHELDYLKPSVQQAPVLGKVLLEVARNPKREARTAELAVRAMNITLMVPRNHPTPHKLQPVELNAIWVEEVTSPSDGGPPIRWLILTTLAIGSFEQVWQCVRWYSYRWLIERFHFTLKSGCGIEQLQLKTCPRMLNALATYNVIAWRVMWLLYQSRLTPDASCEIILQSAEWKLLRRKFAPKSRSRKPPTLQQAVMWIARLGGFLARKSDGNPGLKTLWRGLKRLGDLMEGVRLAAKT